MAKKSSKKPNSRRTNYKKKQQAQNTGFDWQKIALPYIAALVVGLIAISIFVFVINGDDADTDTNDGGSNNQSQVVSIPQRISPNDYQSDFADGQQEHYLIDVRTQPEYLSGYIPNALNIDEQFFTANPAQSEQILESQLGNLPKDTNIVLYCNSGRRSGMVANYLSQAGYTNVYDLGGIQSWTGEIVFPQ